MYEIFAFLNLFPVMFWLLQMKMMRPIDPEKACPFVGQTLKELRSVVGNEATVLGFVGCPYTLATYMVEVRLTTIRRIVI